jgi:dipeptidyl aminopeptidase/acylaminoacyl peptidase
MKQTALLALALSTAVVAAQAQQLTPEQTLNRRGIGELEISPDQAHVLFTVTEPVKGTTRERHVWMLDVAGGGVRQLTFSARSDSAPRWAPDGRSIAFLSDRGGDAQLYRLSMLGGDAEKLTDHKDAITAFRWSPDGSAIAILAAEPKSDALQKRDKDKDDARLAEKDDRLAKIWMVDVAAHAVKPITSEPYRISQIEFAADGRQLIAAASSKPHDDQYNEAIYSVDLQSGRFAPIAAPRGPMGGLAVSPDGATLAYTCARVDGPEAHDLCLQPVAGGAVINLTGAAIDRPVSQPTWIDARTLAINVARGFQNRIETIGVDGRTGTAVDSAGVSPSAFARGSNGTIVYVAESATRAPELWVKPSGAAGRPITTFNAGWATLPVSAPEFFSYKSADGTDIEAALLLPPSVGADARLAANGTERRRLNLPAVILVHGGPTGRWSDTFDAWGQLLASRGYAVLYPNVRGSIGYGQRFVEMNRADWGGGDFKDVMAGADWLVARGIADPDRLGVGGWSYGGYMAAWAVTQTSRFKAAVSGAPVIDMASEFGTENGSAYDEWFYGTPYEKLDGFIKSSPITFVKNVRTPTLLLQGEADTTDPIGQSQQFYRGLKRYGVPSDLVLYPREPHGLREEKHLVDRLNRILAWYDRYLMAARPSDSPHR